MKVGDYVEVNHGLYDSEMPSDGRRDGLVVEIKGDNNDQLIVMFSNCAFLKFHISQLEVINESW
mgnify:CR=1 FL=1|tara:strand:- start:480 stop:671 length:192 start_codon:yes stop_codon:yes gene_type:complete